MSPQSIEINVYHDNEAVDKEVAQHIEDWLPKVPGVVDVVNQTFVIGPAEGSARRLQPGAQQEQLRSL